MILLLIKMKYAIVCSKQIEKQITHWLNSFHLIRTFIDFMGLQIKRFGNHCK